MDACFSIKSAVAVSTAGDTEVFERRETPEISKAVQKRGAFFYAKKLILHLGRKKPVFCT
jgi:hypothetical protein